MTIQKEVFSNSKRVESILVMVYNDFKLLSQIKQLKLHLVKNSIHSQCPRFIPQSTTPLIINRMVLIRVE